MRKSTLLLFLSVFSAANLSAQRISQMTVEGHTSLVPFAAFNPTNNTTTAGDGQIVFPATADLSNVNVTLNCGTDATITEPATLPTNWTSTVSGIKVVKTADGTYAYYNITAKKIIPASLPFTLTTGTGNFDSNSWTSVTVGWAAACIDKAQSLIRFGSAKRSFVVAFSNAPDSLIYTMKSLGTWSGSNNVFDIDGSADGITWTSICQYNSTNIMPASSPSVIAKLKLDQGYRYIRWIYTTRNSGAGAFNVSLENITVTKAQATGIQNAEEQSACVFFDAGNNLQLTNAVSIKNIRIYNLIGNLLLDCKNPKASIEMPQLSAGVYVSKIVLDNGKTISAKLIRK